MGVGGRGGERRGFGFFVPSVEKTVKSQENKIKSRFSTTYERGGISFAPRRGSARWGERKELSSMSNAFFRVGKKGKIKGGGGGGRHEGIIRKVRGNERANSPSGSEKKRALCNGNKHVPMVKEKGEKE